MIDKREKVLIGLGTNLPSIWGKPTPTIQKAIEIIRMKFTGQVDASRLFQTPAFPAGSGPDYVNAAVTLQTDAPPEVILSELHEIEAAAGRTRATRWGARTLDLDLLAVGQQVLPDTAVFRTWLDLDLEDQMQKTPQELILPHPRLQDRAFVLVPLADVAPDWVHPVLGKTVSEMCAALPQAQRAEVRPLPDLP